MFEYEVGGNERKIDTYEAFSDIAHNKTLFIQKLTDQEPIKPEKVEGLKTVKEVFNHYKPKVNLAFVNEDGSEIPETLRFTNLGDFSVKKIISQSKHLSHVNIQKEMSMNVIKQLSANKTLKSALDNEETKSAFVSALKNFVSELETSK
jgi:predicted component of type VI protein secretion system